MGNDGGNFFIKKEVSETRKTELKGAESGLGLRPIRYQTSDSGVNFI